jgi:hypothetical protein
LADWIKRSPLPPRCCGSPKSRTFTAGRIRQGTLADILREAGDLYEAIAENKGIALRIDFAHAPPKLS